MNYASPVFIAVMLFALVDYFLIGHKRFKGPLKEITVSESTSVRQSGEKRQLVTDTHSTTDA